MGNAVRARKRMKMGMGMGMGMGLRGLDERFIHVYSKEHE